MRKFLYHISWIVAVAFCTVQAAAQDGAHMGVPFFRNYSASQYNAHNRNFDVLCDGEGHTFFANFEGLLVYDNVEWRIIHTPDISRVVSVSRDQDGNVVFEGITMTGQVLSVDGDSIQVAYVRRAGENASALAGGERISETAVDRWNDIEVYQRLKLEDNRTLLATATDCAPTALPNSLTTAKARSGEPRTMAFSASRSRRYTRTLQRRKASGARSPA